MERTFAWWTLRGLSYQIHSRHRLVVKSKQNRMVERYTYRYRKRSRVFLIAGARGAVRRMSQSFVLTDTLSSATRMRMESVLYSAGPGGGLDLPGNGARVNCLLPARVVRVARYAARWAQLSGRL